MRRLLFAAGLCAIPFASALYACSSDDMKSMPDAAVVDMGKPDSPVAYEGTCVKTPDVKPFPTGACNSPKPATPDSVDEALTKIGYDRCTLALDPTKMPFAVCDPKDKRQLPDFTPLLSYPLR